MADKTESLFIGEPEQIRLKLKYSCIKSGKKVIRTATSGGGGIGLFTLVFIVFLTLKLAEIGPVANWSWWWVTSPLWIGALLVIGLFLVVFFFVLAFGILKALVSRD